MATYPLFASLPGQAIVASLLNWYGGARRVLPWRTTRTPYAVWVAEIMLQQTRVATVVPFFERWMARFPDVQSLAAASGDDVLKAWEGLGYYSRARNIHAAAQQLVAASNGELPAERAALLALPGVGAYTAGAILSLAFGQRSAILDGNVRRVLCRLADVEEDPRQPDVERRLWSMAQQLVDLAPDGQAGALNEALMELGALVCIPGVPDCDGCPLSVPCEARKLGVQAVVPVRAPKRRVPHRDAVAAVLGDGDGRILLVHRRPSGLLGGMWGFPGGLTEQDQDIVPGLRAAVRDQIGLDIEVRESLIAFEHAYTHFRITLHAFRATIIEGAPAPLKCQALVWTSLHDAGELPLPVTDRRVLEALIWSPAQACD